MSESRKEILNRQIQDLEIEVEALTQNKNYLELEVERKNIKLCTVDDKHELLRRAIEVGSNAYIKIPNEILANLTKKAAEKLMCEIEKL